MGNCLGIDVDMNLNRITLLLAALSFVTGCGKEPVSAGGDGTAPVQLVITASQEEGLATRALLVDGAHVYWHPADAISGFSAGERARFTSQNTASAQTADFVGQVPVSGESGTWVYSLYPFDEEARLDGNRMTTTLPDEQEAVAETFADDLLIMAGRAQTSSLTDLGGGVRKLELSFRHVCSGLRFSLTRSDVETVMIRANGGEALAGTFSFGWDESGEPIVQAVSEPSDCITLTPPGGGTFEAGVWYYVVTLPAQLSGGVTFTVLSGSKSGVRAASSPFALQRGGFRRATKLDSGVTLTEEDVTVELAGPDTWVATDEQRRPLPVDVRSKQQDREVLMFYSSWHCEHLADYGTIVNVTEVERNHPEAMNNPAHAAWGDSSDPTNPQLCFWSQPLFGYYRTTDPWVLRKHAEMLSDAGVDAVFFDCTNGSFLWWTSVSQLLQTWRQALEDGVNVPRVAFLLPFYPTAEAALSWRTLYLNFYSLNSYSDLWYRVDGKPLIVALPDCLANNPQAYDADLLSFFTIRLGQLDYVRGDFPDEQGRHQWGWLQVYPQTNFNNGELMPVSVAQNATDASSGHCYAFNAPGSYGRSYTYQDKQSHLVEPTGTDPLGSCIYGYNFQEQWSRALQQDPKKVFVVGWNEWVAYKLQAWPPEGYEYGGSFGYPNAPGYAFADQFDSERSRDIEPTLDWGEHGDDYYYQLVQNVRRYKGVDGHYPNVSKRTTVAIDGSFTEWGGVSPDFRHYGGNTGHRNHAGHGNGGLTYINDTGRNDFVDAKVTRDKDYIYFYVETKENISPRTDGKWMRLLINIDRKWDTGWKGYDFCLNYKNPASDSMGYVSKSTGAAWGWTDAGMFDYAVNGNSMEIRVARSVLGLRPGGRLNFEFKWCDNNLYDTVPAGREPQILNLYVDGDAAPGGRFNFLYKD